jgi:hypothetical protein
MGYQHLQNTFKAIALTVPAARAFEMTVEFALGEGKDTAAVGAAFVRSFEGNQDD